MAKEKKTASKAKAAPAKCAKCEAYKPLTKTQILQALSEATKLNRKDVDSVLVQLSALIAKSLAEGANASFTLPGLIKIEKQFVPAKEGQKGVPDPFHPGKTIDRPAKPEHYKIKVKALKALKDMA